MAYDQASGVQLWTLIKAIRGHPFSTYAIRICSIGGGVTQKRALACNGQGVIDNARTHKTRGIILEASRSAHAAVGQC